jgi:hypothetical protein
VLKQDRAFVSRQGAVREDTALSRLVAVEAEKLEFVKEFRGRVLGGTLIEYDTIDTWINERLKEDRTQQSTSVPERHTYLYMEWVGPNKVDVERVPALPGGTLERVHDVGIRLADRFLWSKAQATGFLLCGSVPRISAIRLSFRRGSMPSLVRIVMDLDPALNPRKIAALYRDAQLSLIAGRQRQRSLTLKHLSLAVFAAENYRDGKTYRELRTVWNRKHRANPRWLYLSSDSHFAKDCKRAQDKLLLTGYSLKEIY